jgi:hypothetical protein
MSDRGLKSIVADLHDMGYSDGEIAVVVQRTSQRIRQILAECCPRPTKIDSIADLPPYMRERVQQWLDHSDTRTFQNERRAQPEPVGSP